MKFRIISAIVFVLLIVNTMSGESFIFSNAKISVEKSLSYNDQLDQFQTDSSGRGWACVNNYCLAQSFTPTLPILTRVEILCWRVGTPDTLKISIFNELTGLSLASVVIDGESVQPYVAEWVEFDFENISVIPNEPYYIVWNQSDGDMNNTCIWSYGGNNPYPRGKPWHHNGEEWENWENSSIEHGFYEIDFCFKTYGKELEENHPPEPPVITGTISGKIDTEYEYTITTVDPDGDDVYYFVQWGGGCPTLDWIGPYNSGEAVVLNHLWENPGTFNISVMAKDIYDAEGDWGHLEVSMPYYHSPFMDLIEALFDWLIDKLFSF